MARYATAADVVFMHLVCPLGEQKFCLDQSSNGQTVFLQPFAPTQELYSGYEVSHAESGGNFGKLRYQTPSSQPLLGVGPFHHIPNLAFTVEPQSLESVLFTILWGTFVFKITPGESQTYFVQGVLRWFIWSPKPIQIRIIKYFFAILLMFHGLESQPVSGIF